MDNSETDLWADPHKLHRQLSLVMDYPIEYDFFLFEGGSYALWRVYGEDGMYADRASDPIVVQDMYAARAIAAKHLDGEDWFLLPVRDYYLMYYWYEGTDDQYTDDHARSISGADVWERGDDMIWGS